MIEMKEEQERAILVAVDTGEYDAAVSLDELEELAQTAGAVAVSYTHLILSRSRMEKARRTAASISAASTGLNSKTVERLKMAL